MCFFEVYPSLSQMGLLVEPTVSTFFSACMLRRGVGSDVGRSDRLGFHDIATK